MAKTAIEGAERGTTFRIDPDQVCIVGRDTDDGPEHPLFQPARSMRSFDEATVVGMMEFGVLSPINVRKNKAKNDRLEVIEGRGRVINLREANRRLKAAGQPPKQIEVMIRNYKDSNLGATKIISNMHRLNVDVWTLAEDCAQQRDAGHSLESIANWCKLSGDNGAQWVEDTIAILDVIPEIRKEIQAGTIPRTLAVKLAKLTADEQRAAFEAMVAAMPPPEEDTTASPAPDGAVLPGAKDKRGSGVVKAGLAAAKKARQASADADGRARPGRKPAPPPKYTPPTKTMVKKLAALTSDQRTEAGLSKDAYGVIAWLLGERAAQSVPGLKNALRACGVAAVEVE